MTKAPLLWVCALLPAAAAGEGEYEGHANASLAAFPENIDSAHVVGVSVASALSVTLVVGALLKLWLQRRLPLPQVMFVLVWLLIFAVALTTWWGTYGTARGVVHAEAQRQMLTLGDGIDKFESELQAGTRLLFALRTRQLLGAVDLRAPFPAALNAFYTLVAPMHDLTVTVKLLYFGLPDGRFQGVSITSRGASIGMSYDSTVAESAAKCIACPPYDTADACGGVDCADAAAAVECAGTCGAPDDYRWCVPTAEDPNVRVDVALTDELLGDLTMPKCGAFSKRVMYDPRVRPWYKQDGAHGSEVRWTQPYLFASNFQNEARPVGITATLGLGEGEAGVLAVDFDLRGLRRFLLETLAAYRFPGGAMYVLAPPGPEDAAEGPAVLAHTREAGPPPDSTTDETVMRVRDLGDPWLDGLLDTIAADHGSLTPPDGLLDVRVHEEQLVMFRRVGAEGGFEALALITQPYAALVEELNAESSRAVWFALVTGVVCAVTFHVAMRVALRPLGELAEGMAKVSSMELDTINTAASSRITEVHTMLVSFGTMVDVLQEFREYLPPAILRESSSGASLLDTPTSPHARAPAREATAAIAFTDIVGWDSAWESNPEGMRMALKVHHEVVRAVIESVGGYEVKIVGDKFMVAFEKGTLEDSARAAADFGMGVQMRLLAADWPEEILSMPACNKTLDGAWNGLRVRVGVNVGPVDVQVSVTTGRLDYYGPTVNKAARIKSKSITGGVCIGSEVTDALKLTPGMNTLPDGVQVELFEYGLFTLRGIAEPVRLALLVPPALAPRKAFYRSVRALNSMDVDNGSTSTASRPPYSDGTNSAQSGTPLLTSIADVPDDAANVGVHSPTISVTTYEISPTLPHDVRSCESVNSPSPFAATPLWYLSPASHSSGAPHSNPLVLPRLGSYNAGQMFPKRASLGGVSVPTQSMRVVGTWLCCPRSCDIATHENALTEALAQVVKALKATRGVLWNLVGGAITTAWGPGSRIGARHIRSCFTFVHSLQQAQQMPTLLSGGVCVGSVMQCTVGGDNARHVTHVGAPVKMSHLLACAARECEADCLYASLEGAVPRLEALELESEGVACYRPVDTWTIIFPPQAVTVYEIGRMQIDALDSVLLPVLADAEGDNDAPEADTWGWTSHYRKAFRESDHASIGKLPDATSQLVAALLREGRSMRAPIDASLL